jgi:hypothetical protein
LYTSWDKATHEGDRRLKGATPGTSLILGTTSTQQWLTFIVSRKISAYYLRTPEGFNRFNGWNSVETGE